MLGCGVYYKVDCFLRKGSNSWRVLVEEDIVNVEDDSVVGVGCYFYF